MPKILIGTLFSHEGIMLAVTKIGFDRIFLIIDKKPNKDQEKALKTIQDALGKVVEIKTIKTDCYDIVGTAEEAVKTIDALSDKDIIYIDITASRKTQALGLLFAAYTRKDRIKQIIYGKEEDKSMLYLPKLSFNINKSQKRLLEYLEQHQIKSYSEFADKIGLSKAMLYRNMKELKDLGLVEDTEEGVKLTDAGRIAVL